jgi:hypothetical protein
VRQRWFGATGRRVPEIAVDGDLTTEGALVLDEVSDPAVLRRAHMEGTPVVVRCGTREEVRDALAHPEVSCVLVPPSSSHLLDLDLTELTYG